MNFSNIVSVIIIFFSIFTTSIFANSENSETAKESPWLFAPLLSSAPKLGTSLGAMGGYIHKFDELSPASTFVLMGTYSSSDSFVSGIFGKTYFDEDRQRLIAGGIYGTINNEYKDFLGTGQGFKTTDNIHALFTRYQYRIKGDWFIGAQMVMTNYTITGSDRFSNAILEFIGLNGFESNGVGLVIERDTRDNQNSPSVGSSFLIHSLAYRKTFGGEENFDVYALKSSKYFKHFKDYVLALRLDGRWSVDAPAGAYSTVDLRGYTPGQYLAPYMTTLEIEERISFTKKWGAEIFTGVASLYGSGSSSNDNVNWYPSIGAGVNYMLKEEEQMVIRADVATGKAGNYGFYLQFGRAF